MDALQTLIFMSFVVEFLVAAFKKLVSDRSTQLVSMVIGITLCFSYNVGIFSSMGLISRVPLVDHVLSGIIISRGSNAISELLRRNMNNGRSLSSRK